MALASLASSPSSFLAFFLLVSVAFVIAGDQDFSAITCGSLSNVASSYRLHSHEIKWGSGSGQQSVTATAASDDPNSLWVVKGTHGTNCWQGTPLKIGDKIRLSHQVTKRNLHSHKFGSPLSGQQEVSCFGDGGNGDNMDDWEIYDNNNKGKPWTRKDTIKLRHVGTNQFLSTSSRFDFNHNNCGGNCPIGGQLEVAASPYENNEAEWRVAEGIFFPANLLTDE